MLKPVQNLINILSKTLPKDQAARELRWIKAELPRNEWLEACKLRSQYVPLQYILGNQPFGKLDLLCREGVLIPRLDTEEWVLESSNILKDVHIDSILDYCTGSGCVGLGYASELSKTSIVNCVDFKTEAVTLARENYERNKTLLATDVTITKGNLFENYLPSNLMYSSEKKNNLLVSNPPYIPIEDLTTDEVEESVLKFEPKEALLGDLEFYEALCDNILLKHSSFNGFLFELGYRSQADKVRKLLNDEVWRVGIRNDQNGKLRNVLGWKKNSTFGVLDRMVHEYI